MTRLLWRNRWLVGVMALLGAVAGYFGSRLLERVYRADVLTTPVAADAGSGMRSLIGQYSSLASLAGINLGGGDAGSTAITIATLKSRVFLEKFIEAHQLLPILFARNWDAAAGRWRPMDKGAPPTAQDGAGYLLKYALQVLEERDKGLVTVRVEWRDPKQAAEWANALVADLNAEMRRRAVQNAETTLEYLQREYENTAAIDVRQSIAANIQMQVNRRAMANTRPEYSLTVLDPAVAPDARSFARPSPH